MDTLTPPAYSHRPAAFFRLCLTHSKRLIQSAKRPVLALTVAFFLFPAIASASDTSASVRAAPPPLVTLTPINLTSFYDLHASDPSQFGTWEVVPKGLQTFNGIPFDVGGMIRLFGRVPPPHGTIYRNEVTGIEVGRRFEKLHLLHGTGWTTEGGEIIADVVLHYADGNRASFPLIYGRHVRDWWHRDLLSPSGVTDPDSGVAWIGYYGVGLRLYQTSLHNPHPEKEVATIDIVSARSAVTPAILSITAGPDMDPLPEEQLGRNLSDEDNTILVQVVDETTGTPVPETGHHLTYQTPQTYIYWGSFSGGPEGLAELTYPESTMTRLTVTVFARGYEPASIIWHPGEGETIPRWHIMKLKSLSSN